MGKFDCRDLTGVSIRLDDFTSLCDELESLVFVKTEKKIVWQRVRAESCCCGTLEWELNFRVQGRKGN
jgi:hypothetical protein